MPIIGVATASRAAATLLFELQAVLEGDRVRAARVGERRLSAGVGEGHRLGIALAGAVGAGGGHRAAGGEAAAERVGDIEGGGGCVLGEVVLDGDGARDIA